MQTTLILISGAIFLTIGDVVFKYWTGHEKLPLYILGLLLYLIGLMFLVWSYKFENIEVASALLVIFNIIALTVIGWLYFNERISVIELLGIAAGVVSIALLERS